MKFLYFCLKCLLAISLLCFVCEYILYYVILIKCRWPGLETDDFDGNSTVRAIILADIHMLGPRKGHWLDKMRREWQMHRVFQTSMSLYHPDVVFVLGDIFDEGYFVTAEEFKEYTNRFRRLFYTPSDTRLIAVVGNHDIGFHYRAHPSLVYRFEKAFDVKGVNMYTIKGVNFVTINSIAMEGDQCELCREAKAELQSLSKTFQNCNSHDCRPILLQHFPTYRSSDEACIEKDAPKYEVFREKWEVISKAATAMIGKALKPRVAFSGHSHNYCRTNNSLNIEEFTLASYSWRNKDIPSFVLAKFNGNEYNVLKCEMPTEVTIIVWYAIGVSVLLTLLIGSCRRSEKRSKIC